MGEDNSALVERFRAAIESGDIGQYGRALIESASDDYVQEWPQSGERIVGREGAVKLAEGYEAATGMAPKLRLGRISGSGDVYVFEGTMDYGDGTPVSYIGIAEFRDGKVRKVTEYFANPFEAPAWRAGMVERMESVGV